MNARAAPFQPNSPGGPGPNSLGGPAGRVRQVTHGAARSAALIRPMPVQLIAVPAKRDSDAVSITS